MQTARATLGPDRSRSSIVAAALFLLPLLSDLAAAQTTITPDDPAIRYSDFMLPPVVMSTSAVFLRNTIGANCCTLMAPGARVNFRSDATSISMTVRIFFTCPLPICSDFRLEVDGALVPGGIGAGGAAGVVTVPVFSQTTATPHDFSLIFPIASEVEFLDLTLNGGTAALLSPAPIRPRLKYAAYGDSITHGLFATDITTSYPHLVGAMRGWSAINMGFSGHTMEVADGTAVGQVDADLISVALGTNDFDASKPGSTFQTDYDDFLTKLRNQNPTVPVLAITPIWRGNEATPNSVGLDLEAYRQIIRMVVEGRSPPDPNLYLIEGRDLVPPSPTHFAIDLLHPNDMGFTEYATQLAKLNLARDAGFENGAALWSGQGATSITTTTVHSGTNAMQIGPGAGSIRQNVSGVTGGRCYTLSAFARVAAGGTGRFGFDAIDINSNVLLSQFATVTGTTYQASSFTVTAPAGTVRAEIWADNNAGSSTFFIDDLALPLAEPSHTFFYGCGVNPNGSLTIASGAPTPGATLVFGVHNPSGTQGANVTVPFVAVTLAPDAAFPCGTLAPGFGMMGGGAAGEVLVSLNPADAVVTLIGPAWTGVPANVPFAIPASCTALGIDLFAQGLMIDTNTSFAALTGAVEFRIGQ